MVILSPCDRSDFMPLGGVGRPLRAKVLVIMNHPLNQGNLLGILLQRFQVRKRRLRDYKPNACPFRRAALKIPGTGNSGGVRDDLKTGFFSAASLGASAVKLT